MPKWEPAADRGLWALSDPRLSNPSQDEKKCCYGQRNLGVNIAVCPCLQLISHTEPTSTLSRIKCERYIFKKKVFICSLKFVIMFDYVLHIFVYVCGYTTLEAIKYAEENGYYLVWVLFNCISTSVDYLMPKGLDWFCLLCMFLGFGLMYQPL